MRLTLKFVLAFTLGNILLAAVYGYWAVRREVRHFRHRANVEAESLGRALEDMLADAWRRSGQQGVLQVVRKVNQGQAHELRVRWVWFDARPGDPCFPSVSPERLTTVTIEQHVAVEALDPDGRRSWTSIGPWRWLPAPRRPGVCPGHERVAGQ